MNSTIFIAMSEDVDYMSSEDIARVTFIAISNVFLAIKKCGSINLMECLSSSLSYISSGFV